MSGTREGVDDVSPPRVRMTASAETWLPPPSEPVVLSLSSDAALIRREAVPPLVHMSDHQQAQLHPVALKLSQEVAIQMQEDREMVGVELQLDEVQVDDELELGECSLCLGDKPDSEFTFVPGCGHTFCTDCFQHFLKVEAGKGNTQVKCPDTSCRAEITDQEFLEQVNHRATQRLARNAKKDMRRVKAMTTRSRCWLTTKFWLGTVRNLCFLGCLYPQSTGCMLPFTLFTCAGCCCCFCGCCCGCCCGSRACEEACCCSQQSCDFEVCLDPRDDLPFLFRMLICTCWGNDVEVCPHCTSIVNYGGGCPNIKCSACGRAYVRDQQWNFAFGCCVFGLYVPFFHPLVCCSGEGTPCCDAKPNMWCLKL